MSQFKALAVEDSPEKTSLNQVELYAEEVMKNLIDPHFTDHSIAHSRRILKIIDRILFQTGNSQLLTRLEKYILIAAVYLHDIGMQEELKVPDDNKRRATHDTLSIQRIQKEIERIGIIPDLANPICIVVGAHRGNFTLENHITIRTCEEIRIDLLERLLFIGDELDISHERVDIKNIGRLKFDIENTIHFYKHYYTYGIDIKDNRLIEIVFRMPPGRQDQYKFILETYVVKKLQASLSVVRKVLHDKYRIDIALIESQGVIYRDDPTIESIDSLTYEKIIYKLFLPKGVTYLDKHKFESMLDCHDPNLFYNGCTRWEDIVNELDITRSQTSDIQKKINTALKYSCENQCLSLVLITGEACSGKTTLLMRLAHNMATDTDFQRNNNILWYENENEYDHLSVLNLYKTNQKPIIIFIDTQNIKSFIEDYKSTTEKSEQIHSPAVMIITARQSEWDNVDGENKINAKIKLHEPVGRLQDNEIIDLLNKLENFDKLDELKRLTPEDRFEKFKIHCDRQLLVAMLEATKDKRFEEIILDEYLKLKTDFSEAANAYELVALFYMYNVSTPETLLIRYLDCDDQMDFHERFISHTRLIIVKDVSERRHDCYKARHVEIARILLAQLKDYDTEEKRLKKVGIVINNIDPFNRNERYFIINFLKNYLENVVRFEPKKDFEDNIDAIRSLILRKEERVRNMIEVAFSGQHIAELFLLARISDRLGIMDLRILTLKKICQLKPYDIKGSYLLATALRKNPRKTKPSEIAMLYKNSYIGGNRNIKFMFEYLHYCINNKIHDHIEPFIDGIDDFVTFSYQENEYKKKLSTILKGYKIDRDSDRMVTNINDLLRHVNASRDLDAKDTIFYIDTYESSNTKQAVELYEQHLLAIVPTRPKSIIFRLAYAYSKLDGQEMESLKYYEELYEQYIKKAPSSYDFQAVFAYLSLGLRQKVFAKEKAYELYSFAKRLNPLGDIALYVEFAGFLIHSSNYKDLVNCDKVVQDGLKAANDLDKIYTSFAKKLRLMKSQLQEKMQSLGKSAT